MWDPIKVYQNVEPSYSLADIISTLIGIEGVSCLANCLWQSNCIGLEYYNQTCTLISARRHGLQPSERFSLFYQVEQRIKGNHISIFGQMSISALTSKHVGIFRNLHYVMVCIHLSGSLMFTESRALFCI